MEEIIRFGQQVLFEFGLKILVTVLILILGRWVAKLLTGVLRRLMERSKVETTIVSFVGNLVYYALLTFVVLAAVAELGVQTTSFILKRPRI